MGKILIVAHGTRGTFVPLLRLSRTLIRRGHHVTVSAAPNQARLAAEWALPFVGAGPDFGPENLSAIFDKSAEAASKPATALRAFAEQVLKPYFVPGARSLATLASGFDGILANCNAIWVKPVAEACRKPYATIHFTVLNFRSDWYSPAGAPVPESEMKSNRRAWDVSAQVNRRYLAGPIRPLYEELGFAAPEQLLAGDSLSPHLNLLPIDPACAAPAPDWPRNLAQTGYFHAEPEELAAVPAAAREYVEADRDRPLIMFAFGSLGFRCAESDYRALAAVARRHGARVLAVTGWGEQACFDGAEAFSLSSISYDWLFPRASLVVHHGGAGTTGECFRHAVPQAVAPQGFYDQFENAARVQALGCGFQVAPGDLDPARFEELLARALPQLPDLRRSAEKVRGQLQPDGREACCVAIEQMIG